MKNLFFATLFSLSFLTPSFSLCANQAESKQKQEEQTFEEVNKEAQQCAEQYNKHLQKAEACRIKYHELMDHKDELFYKKLDKYYKSISQKNPENPDPKNLPQTFLNAYNEQSSIRTYVTCLGTEIATIFGGCVLGAIVGAGSLEGVILGMLVGTSLGDIIAHFGTTPRIRDNRFINFVESYCAENKLDPRHSVFDPETNVEFDTDIEKDLNETVKKTYENDKKISRIAAWTPEIVVSLAAVTIVFIYSR